MRWFSPIPWVGSTTVHSVGDPAGLNLWAAQIQVLSSALGTGCHPGHHSSTGFWWGSLGREKTGLTGSGQPLSPGEGVGREDVSASGWQVPGCGPGSSGPARVCVCLESVLRPRGYEEQVKNHHDRWIEAVGKRIMVCILIEKKKKEFYRYLFSCFLNKEPYVFILHWAGQVREPVQLLIITLEWLSRNSLGGVWLSFTRSGLNFNLVTLILGSQLSTWWLTF